MGILDVIKDQFIDVIDYIDEDGKTIVKKYSRTHLDNDEIKTGAKVIVRPSQAAVFFSSGQFADVLKEGTHELTTNNLPVLSSLKALPHLFNSPIKADLYFVSLRQFVGNKWSTKNHLIIRDSEFKMIRIKSSGAFGFKIIDTDTFVKEVLGTQRKFSTDDIVEYLESYLVEAFSVVLGEIDIPIIDLATQYSKLADLIQLKANIKIKKIGIELSELVIENITLPENVEKLIDEQSGIGMVKDDMSEFVQYQSARAIRDVANQPGGIAGIGASVMVGKQIAKTMEGEVAEENNEVKVRCGKCNTLNNENVKFCFECGEALSTNNTTTNKSVSDDLYESLIEYKKLLDDGTLTQVEYDKIKHQLLNK